MKDAFSTPNQNNPVMTDNQIVLYISHVAPVIRDINPLRLIGKTLISLLIHILLAVSSSPALAQQGLKEEGLEAQPFSDLNLRFSNQPITPPDTLIIQTIQLTGISVARPFVAPAPQAVIFEDDRRQRVAVLSTDSAETLTLYLLEHLSLDHRLPTLVQCANNRECDADRTPLTGGLGCLALCIKELLELSALNH